MRWIWKNLSYISPALNEQDEKKLQHCFTFQLAKYCIFYCSNTAPRDVRKGIFFSLWNLRWFWRISRWSDYVRVGYLRTVSRSDHCLFSKGYSSLLILTFGNIFKILKLLNLKVFARDIWIVIDFEMTKVDKLRSNFWFLKRQFTTYFCYSVIIYQVLIGMHRRRNHIWGIGGAISFSLDGINDFFFCHKR